MVQPLYKVMEEVPDPRAASGRRYPLGAILLLMCGGLMCGYRTPNQIALWGQELSREFLQALGFKRGIAPGKSVLYEVLRRLDVAALEERLAGWAESVLQELTAGEAEGPLQGIAIDGKTLRGSRKQGAPLSHLLSAVSHGIGLTLYQVAVDEKTNEIPLAEELLCGLLLEGRVVTMDALLTQRRLAEQIVAAGGEYIMMAKGNQPTLEADIELAFADFSPYAHERGHARQRGARPDRAPHARDQQPAE